MTHARSKCLCQVAIPYYHRISCRVRRVFLRSEDTSGNYYKHRRTWVTPRLRKLIGVFAIDIRTCAVMSNSIIWCYGLTVAKAGSGTTGRLANTGAIYSSRHY